MIKLQDIFNQLLEEEKKKADRCKRIADRKYDKPSAYKSGSIVRCRQGKIWKDLKEELVIEYSNKIVNKFKQEDPKLTDDEVKKVLDRFDQIKNNLYEKDILKYNWDELVDTILDYEPKRIKAGKINKGEVDNADLVYNQNNIRVYKANSEKSCIKYGKGYAFCISSRGDGNEYSNYRYGGDGNPRALPYFVFDDSRSSDKDKNSRFIDPTHLLVVMVHDPNDGGGYVITGANNNDSTNYDTFEKAIQKYPQLKGLENILKYESPSSNDTEFIKIEKNKAIDRFIEKNKIPRTLRKSEAINLLNNKLSSAFINYKIFEFTEIFKSKKIEKSLVTYPSKKEALFGAKQTKKWYLRFHPEDPIITITVKEVPIEGKLKSILQDYVELIDYYDKQILKSQGLKETSDPQSGKAAPYGSGYARLKEIIVKKLQEKETLRTWFKRKGAPGKTGGWVDCNTCRNGKCKPCGRKEGEKRAKYPSCRPTPAQCKTKGKGKKWGKTK